MPKISLELREAVIRRAQNCCEYCKSPQEFASVSYEVDHIIALKHQGLNTLDNLALACLHCNRHKGSDLTTFDPETGQLTRLFHPRLQAWSDHFELRSAFLLGISDVGRATVQMLQMNDLRKVKERAILIARHLYPVTTTSSD